jgi:hypothetical protein
VIPEAPSAKAAERCERHPGQPSVATCHRCGVSLCLACAVPVRGEVLGPECLGQVLGEEPVPPPEVPRGRPTRWAAGVGLLIASAGTVLPWTHFGTGASPFGAWAFDARWSLAAAIASVVGLAAWIVTKLRWPSIAVAVGGVAGVLAAAAAGLAVANPPPLTHAWIGSWVTLAGGAFAALSAALGRRAQGGPVA